MSWMQSPLIFEGQKVLLLPLEWKHFDELAANSNDELIWTGYFFNGCNKEELRAFIADGFAMQDKGLQYLFAVIDKLSGKIIGSTRFLKISEEHKNLEIGSTWYHPGYWGKGYNEECKLLLLTYCFETLKTVRVQIVANEKNTRSRNAILRIGAQFEGVLRNKVIRNGVARSSAYHSILPEEWEVVRGNLETLIKERFAKFATV